MSASIIDIGNTLQLRDDTDPNAKVTTWFRQGLNIVDIMPAHFKLDLNHEVAKFAVYNTGKPLSQFQTRCKTYGLDGSKKLARLWITGESTFQEEISNEYQTNSIESMINGLMGTAVGSYANMFRSVGAGAGGAISSAASSVADSSIGKAVSSVVTSSLKAGGVLVSSIIGKDATNIVKNVGNVIKNNLLSFKHLSVPKTYSGSSYNPSLNFNIRLVSPYGHPEAIQHFIVAPLTYLMLLAPPTTSDGVTYGNANYVSVRAYGIADIDLAIIENISIRRGGNDVAYNKYRQPLSVDVNISIKPAAAGFAVDQGHSKFKDKQYNKGNKVAMNIATAPDISSSKMRSSMVTLGNMLESFKAAPFPENSIAMAAPLTKVQKTKNTKAKDIKKAANVKVSSMLSGSMSSLSKLIG